MSDSEYKGYEPPAELSFPDVMEIESADFNGLEEVWRSNDKALLDVISKRPVNFFGLHGASHSDLEKIKSINTQDKELLLQTTTFFHKPERPRDLLDLLYANASYSSSYAFYKMNRAAFDGPGGLAVINLSSEDGDNIAHKEREAGLAGSDRVKPQAGLGFLSVNPKNADQQVAGIIEDADLVSYAGYIERENEILREESNQDKKIQLDGKINFAERFLIQKIVYEALKKLNITK